MFLHIKRKFFGDPEKLITLMGFSGSPGRHGSYRGRGIIQGCLARQHRGEQSRQSKTLPREGQVAAKPVDKVPKRCQVVPFAGDARPHSMVSPHPLPVEIDPDSLPWRPSKRQALEMTPTNQRRFSPGHFHFMGVITILN